MRTGLLVYSQTRIIGEDNDDRFVDSNNWIRRILVLRITIVQPNDFHNYWLMFFDHALASTASSARSSDQDWYFSTSAVTLAR